MSRSKTLGRSPHYEEPALALALIHPSAWRDCLRNPQRLSNGTLGPPIRATQSSLRGLETTTRSAHSSSRRFFRQSLEEELSEVQPSLAIVIEVLKIRSLRDNRV